MADTEPREPRSQMAKDVAGTILTVVWPFLAFCAIFLIIVGGWFAVACSTGPCL